MPLSRQRAVNTISRPAPGHPAPRAHTLLAREATLRGGERHRAGEEEVSLALPGVSSGDYASQDSINLSTPSVSKGGGDIPLPQVSRRVVGKDSNPLSSPSSATLLSSFCRCYFFPPLFFSSTLRRPPEARPFSLLAKPRPLPRAAPCATGGLASPLFPCIPDVDGSHRRRRVNIRDSGVLRIHWKLADLDGKSRGESTNFRGARRPGGTPFAVWLATGSFRVTKTV